MPDLFGEESAAVARGAVLSPCGTYRYRLWRTWDAALRPACFVMLNPSTADATRDDPTIRRCVAFARAWGCGGVVVVNLFAYRATEPGVLRAAAGPVGPENDRHVLEAALAGAPVVAAWGVHGTLRGRGREVRRLLAGVSLQHLGLTKDGHPRHPLYVKGDAALVPFPLEER